MVDELEWVGGGKNLAEEKVVAQMRQAEKAINDQASLKSARRRQLDSVHHPRALQ